MKAVIAMQISGNEMRNDNFLKLPVTALEKDESDEVWYQHNLYDVAKRININGSEYVYLYHDTEEQQLLATHIDYFKYDPGLFGTKGIPSGSMKTIPGTTDYTYYFDALQKMQVIAETRKIQYLQSNFRVINVWDDVPVPPPRRLFS
jgi:hypothetical protein